MVVKLMSLILISGKMRLLVHLKSIGIYTVFLEILENASNKNI